MPKAGTMFGKMATPTPRSKGKPMATPKPKAPPKNVAAMRTPKARKGG